MKMLPYVSRSCAKTLKAAWESTSWKKGSLAEIIIADANAFRDHLLERMKPNSDNNKTADNAHVLLSWSNNVCIVVLEQVVHAWELPSEAMISLCEGQGSRQGAASIFNEYMPSYEHDWQAADFNLTHYAKGYRSPETDTHFAAPKADDDLNY